MTVVEQRWPVLGRHECAAEWLRVWADLGRSPRTIDAYARALAEFLLSCEAADVDPLTATRVQVAAYVRELVSRPSMRGPNVVSFESGVGLANATLQQRLSVTWNLPVRMIIFSSFDHGLERAVGRQGSAADEVAGVGSARAGGGVAAGVGRSWACASDD
jgi:hypothetical protein